jgi:hypothetical protein
MRFWACLGFELDAAAFIPYQVRYAKAKAASEIASRRLLDKEIKKRRLEVAS